MTQSTALLIEASGIQEYIFGSNQLSQNIGASELVTQATTDWLFDERSGLLPRPHNVRRAQQGAASRWHIGDQSLANGLAAEVIYAGGGNALILFAAEEEAKKTIYSLTRKALRDAPGLRLEAAWRSFAQGKLVATVNILRDQISQQKRSPQRSSPMLGLGVTAACDFTGAPAVGVDDEGRYVSAEVRTKQRAGAANGPGNGRLLEYLHNIRQANFEFVYDFNQLGEREETSYLAVVHTDGNRMGERIQSYVDQFASDDAAYVKAQREFSQKVQSSAQHALNSTVGLMLAPNNLKWDNQKRRYLLGGQVPIPRVDGIDRLPFRPIVFGGDDVTFVCEGRLGLPLAAHYLSRLAEEKLPDGDPLYARAGVAIVRTHYPFARAYELADALCDSAKRLIQEIDRQTRRVAALDWHFAVTGLVRPLGELRRREYTVADGPLLMRPIRLTPVDPNEWRSWNVFSNIVDKFAHSRDWAGRRNKVKALREALRAGPDATRLFLRNLPDSPRLPETPELTSAGDATTTGWQGNRCVYFDAIEALDFYVSLEGV